jgi:hypothetical protein
MFQPTGTAHVTLLDSVMQSNPHPMGHAVVIMERTLVYTRYVAAEQSQTWMADGGLGAGFELRDQATLAFMQLTAPANNSEVWTAGSPLDVRGAIQALVAAAGSPGYANIE